MRQIVVGGGAILLIAGCSSIFEPGERSILLPITQVVAPSTVAPGAGFSVTFTVESGGCKSFDRLETTRSGAVLTAVAHGTQAVGKNIVCPTDIRYDSMVQEVVPPVSDPFSIVARQPDGTEATVQVRVQ